MSYPTVYSDTMQIDHPYIIIIIIIIIIISVQFLTLFFFSKGLGHLRVYCHLMDGTFRSICAVPCNVAFWISGRGWCFLEFLWHASLNLS